VWVDTLQAFAMMSAVIVVVIMGTIEVGGVGEILERASDSGRLVFFK
jgi:Na+/proline symporter